MECDQDTDKEYVPGWDGTPPMKTFEPKIEIYESKTKTPKEERGVKILERLTGEAFDATETLEIKELQHEEGVKTLFDFLRNSLEPPERQRVGKIADDFLSELSREKNQETS